MRKQYFFIFFFILLSTICKSQESDDKLQVVGKAIIEAIPENIQIDIPFKVIDSTINSCTDNLIYKLTFIQNQIKELGVKDNYIKTLDFSFGENYVYKDRERKQQGYIGTVRLQIIDKYTPNLVNEIIKIFKSNEMNYSISFKLSKEQKEKLSEIVIERAIQDAKNKAKTISTKANVSLDKITRINYDYSSYTREIIFADEEEEVEDMGLFSKIENLKLSPKEISIEKSILIEWKITDKN
jgi:uncharacterized protein YggE